MSFLTRCDELVRSQLGLSSHGLGGLMGLSQIETHESLEDTAFPTRARLSDGAVRQGKSAKTEAGALRVDSRVRC